MTSSSFHHGDRIKYATTGDDGLPLVRYGCIGGVSNGDGGPVVVMLDGELNGNVVDLSKVEAVTIGNVTLRLDGADLLDDPSLRQGLVRLWQAEAEDAGLQISSLHPIGTGVRDSSEGYALAEMMAAGQQYVLRACTCPTNPEAIVVKADVPNRWTT